MKSNRRDHGDSPRRREFKSGREAVNQSVETNLSGFNYGEEHDIYIYIYSKDIRARHLREITALAVSCIAITHDEKTCPDIFRYAHARD